MIRRALLIVVVLLLALSSTAHANIARFTVDGRAVWKSQHYVDVDHDVQIISVHVNGQRIVFGDQGSCYARMYGRGVALLLGNACDRRSRWVVRAASIGPRVVVVRYRVL